MDERLRKRIVVFYLAGIINVFLGLYVFIEGVTFLPRETATWLVLFFLVFAVVDFYFAYVMKRKWEHDQTRLRAGGGAAGDGTGSQK